MKMATFETDGKRLENAPLWTNRDFENDNAIFVYFDVERDRRKNRIRKYAFW